jgi:hypothetical protein
MATLPHLSADEALTEAEAQLREALAGVGAAARDRGQAWCGVSVRPGGGKRHLYGTYTFPIEKVRDLGRHRPLRLAESRRRHAHLPPPTVASR